MCLIHLKYLKSAPQGATFFAARDVPGSKMTDRPDSIASEQIRRNRAARAAWELYGPHRRRVTDLLAVNCDEPGRRLCVLGAGNCNDLDLARLLARFEDVHLVDLDGEALADGIARQGLDGSPRIRLHGGVDVTGALPLLAELSPATAPDDDRWPSWLDRAVSATAAGLPGPFDVVASVGLLTQLIDAVGLTLGTDHPRFLELVQAVRIRHLRLLLELARPGGAAVLLTEVVSSDTCPELPRIPEAELPQALVRLIGEHNFFTGANPFVLLRLFQTDPVCSQLAAEARLSHPWIWQFTHRFYAVCAIRVRLRSEW